jgi:hypothetical protein
MLVRMSDAGVQVEQPAGFSGGEGYQVAPVFTGYESWRGENLSTGIRSPF